MLYDEELKSVFIPNEEIRREFVWAVKSGRYAEIADLARASDELPQAILNLDGEKAASVIEKVYSMSTAPIFYKSLRRYYCEKA